jgi:hypothetical protein
MKGREDVNIGACKIHTKIVKYSYCIELNLISYLFSYCDLFHDHKPVKM